MVQRCVPRIRAGELEDDAVLTDVPVVDVLRGLEAVQDLRQVRLDRANLRGLVLGCIEANFCK